MSTALEQLRSLVREMPGRKMPGERELAERFGVGRKQIRSALDVLEMEGIVLRRQGSGTFAADVRQARSMTVALLVDAALRLGDDPFFSLLVDRLQRALQGAGIRCLVERMSENEAAVPKVHAAITVGLAGSAVVASMEKNSPPVVGLFLPETVLRPDRRVSLLVVDDRLAGATAAQCLIDHGCKSLVFAGMNDLPMSRRRLMGAHRVTDAASVSLRAIRSGSNFQAGLLVARSLTPDPAAPLGIVAANDWMAVGIQTGMMSKAASGYRIVGFDGLDIAADPALGIESVMFPLDGIVDDAVSEILRLTPAPNVPGRVIQYAPIWRA